MSDFKSAKDALVVSLFELSKAAQEAASSTVDFFKVASQEGVAGETLDKLGNDLNGLKEKAEAVGQGTKFTGDHGSKDKKAEGKADQENETKNDAAGEGDGDQKKKKKKTEKDPNAPKKPLTIFFAFSFYNRDQLRKERQKEGLAPLSSAEMNEIIKERWNSISAEEKSKWQKKYQDELKEYQGLKEAYNSGKPINNGASKGAENDGKASAPVAAPADAPPSPTATKESAESKKRKKEDSDRGEKAEKADKHEKSEKADKADKGEKSEKEGKESKKKKSKKSSQSST